MHFDIHKSTISAEVAPMSGDNAKLTPKQDAFARLYLETGNAAEAYRRAYDTDENAKDNWIYVEACQLLDNPKVARRVKELQDQAARLSLYTVTQAFQEYEQARALAITEKNPSAAVGAVSGKVKLFGLEAPKHSKHELTGKDGKPIKVEQVEGAAKLASFLDALADRTSE
ncbi:terminase small subunit [Phaeobacter sp. JH203A]